jgi:phosphonate transport system substrate-binding protein
VGGLAALLVTAVLVSTIGAPQRAGPEETLGRPVALALPPDGALSPEDQRELAGSLASAARLDWDVRAPRTYGEAVDELCSRAVEVAFLDAVAAVLAFERNCLSRVLVARRAEPGGESTSSTAEVLVLADGGVRDLADLRGKAFAFADESSLTGTLYPALLVMRRTGEPPRTYFARTLYAGSEARALQALLRGEADAAAASAAAREEAARAAPELRERTRVIETIAQVPHPIAALRLGLAEDLADRISRALVEEAAAAGSPLRGAASLSGLEPTTAYPFLTVRSALRAAGLDAATLASRTPRPR